MPHPLFSPEVRFILEKNDGAAMREFTEALHSATVAEALDDHLKVEDSWRFLSHSGIDKQADIFSYLPPEEQVRLVHGVGKQQMAELIEHMGHDDRANLLRRLGPQVRDAILRLIDEAERRDIASLVNFPEDTAGSIMTTDYAWLPANISVDDALERLRLQAPDRETIYYVFLVDEQRRLQGVVSLRTLILAPRKDILADIMETELVTVGVTDPKEKVAQLLARYDLLAIPVVDADSRLIGIVTHDDAMDAVVSAATEDAHLMGGVGPVRDRYLEASFGLIWKKRSVWLSCLFLAELFTFTALSYFEDAISRVIVLSLFIPLCISTGGNSGSQAATLITRALALNEVRGRDWLRIFRHELLMGVALGVTLGLIGFFRASLTPESVRGSSHPRHEAFTIKVPASAPLVRETSGIYLIPGGISQTMVSPEAERIRLPENFDLKEPAPVDGMLTYDFPERCSLTRPPLDRWSLALVIGLSVFGICVWGTLVGSMLPLVFQRIGVDPGIASSPFVATFVDVTGIVIYFSIAGVFLGNILL
ncbi:MAG: magnesium transporter [Gemmataceae bacterium]|nr:magnesium transporter [Gemmataceae bacterium]